MFLFKNIDTWDNAKLKKVKWLLNAFYLIATVIIPLVIVMINYSLFEAVSARIKLTGVGICVCIIVVFWGYKKLNEVIDSLPDNTYKERCVRYGLKWLFTAIPYAIMFIAMTLVKEELTRAYNTLFGCIICFAIATTLKHLFMDFLTAETKLRNEAVKDNEKMKRRKFI